MRPHEVLPSLEELPVLLGRVVEGLVEDDLRRRPVADGFAVVEQAWHLADLEVEGYGVRIERLLAEEDPELPDFDGEAVAKARRYQSLDAGRAVRRFQLARAANLARLRAVPRPAWRRSGRQEGLGPVELGHLPRMMLDHDRSHARELASLLAEIASGHPALPALRALGQLR